MMDKGKSAAEADVTQVGAGAGAGRAGVGAAYESAGAETIADVGQAEAYLLQMKRLVASELDHDQFKRANSERLIRNGEDGDQTRRGQGERAVEQALLLQAQLNNLFVTHIGNLNAQAVAERERTVREGDLAVDRQWNINETDAYAALTIDAVAEAVAKKLKQAK